MNSEDRKWAPALLWVISQYAEGRYVRRDAEGQLLAFAHQCMSAGEGAADLLVEAGLGRDQGWEFVLNQEAIDLMQDFLPRQIDSPVDK